MPALIDAITPSEGWKKNFDTTKWFDPAHEHSDDSPIDEFIRNQREIVKLLTSGETVYNATLGSLIYLGLVSAAESYVRSLLRRLILVDEVCMRLAESREIPYSAALHHSKNLMPEAIFEGTSFASARNVATELRALCAISGMSPDHFPVALDDILQAYDDICQIRHCGVHRFGKLGSRQAMKLGIQTHKFLLEKPLNLKVDDLLAVAETLLALVTGINNYCFADVIKRSYTHSNAGGAAKDKIEYLCSWKLKYKQDRSRFHSYYNVFRCTQNPHLSQPLKETYDEFVIFAQEYDAERAKKRGTKAKKPAQL